MSLSDRSSADPAAPTSTLKVDTALSLPHLGEGHKLRAVVAAALDKASVGGRPVRDVSDGGPAFTAAHFQLDKTRFYTGASEGEQRAILNAVSDAMLHEAYFIEKAGLTYGAKMSLLSESTEEKMLYALFAADEARHLHAVGTHLDNAEALTTQSPFHALLADLIDHGERAALVFIVQVVLEGWGLSHYRDLAEACVRPNLRDVFRGILEDEARHHGSGKVMVDERGIEPVQRAAITDVLMNFLTMVRSGPQSVLAAVDESLGGLSKSQKLELLTDVGGEAQSAERLALLRRLMTTRDSAPILGALDDAGMFDPLPVAACL